MTFFKLITIAVMAIPFLSLAAAPRISCMSPDGKVKVEAVKIDWTSPYPRLDTDIMVVRREGQKEISTTVHAITLNNNLVIVNEGRINGTDLMRINMGRMNAENIYPRAKLILKQGSYLGGNDRVTKPVDEKIDLKCTITEDLGVSNVCDADEDSAYNERLMKAVKDLDADGVEQAVACGADVNAANEAGCSALMIAIDYNATSCKKPEEKPRLDSYESWKARYIFTMLLSEGASTSQVDNLGESIAHKLVRYYEPKLISVLKADEADLNIQNKWGVTPIMLAVMANSRPSIEALLKAEVDLKKKNILGLTAYDMSVHLDENLRSMLNPNAQLPGIVVKGDSKGACSPTTINVKMGKPTTITLQATASDMFMMTAPDLDLEIMAAAGGNASKTINTNKMGTFKFECGVHGGRMTQGKIIVAH